MVDQIKESLSSAETVVKGLVDSFVTDMKLASEKLVSTTSECDREQTEAIEVRKSQLLSPAMYLKTVVLVISDSPAKVVLHFIAEQRKLNRYHR